MTERENPFWTALFGLSQVAMQASVLVVMGGIGVVGYQCIQWLKDGYWTAMPIGPFVPETNIDWSGARGVEIVWKEILTLPTSGVVIGFGVLLFVTAVWLSTVADNKLNVVRARNRASLRQ
jgi:hypothetical protein